MWQAKIRADLGPKDRYVSCALTGLSSTHFRIRVKDARMHSKTPALLYTLSLFL